MTDQRDDVEPPRPLRTQRVGRVLWTRRFSRVRKDPAYGTIISLVREPGRSKDLRYISPGRSKDLRYISDQRSGDMK